MNRREVSGSPLRNHSTNYEIAKRTREGRKKNENVPKKVANAQRKKARRFQQATGKIKNIFQGQNEPETPVSYKDLRYMKNVFRVIGFDGRQANLAETLQTLSVIECVTCKPSGDGLSIGIIGDLLIRSTRQVIVCETICRGLEEPISYLRQKGMKIETFPAIERITR